MSGCDHMKTIAMYLPQYHCIPENDRRIYKGFTEWDLVKKAQSLFDGHYQPRIPLGANYYNLLNLETFKWQSALAKQYGIDAFCFYHYYFDHQSVVMNRPLKLLLDNKEIAINYCFCWANESWGKNGNKWTNQFNAFGFGGEEIIQKYGSKIDWELHYQYMRKFFIDYRYLKINDKPIFVIYKPEDIKDLSLMTALWNKLAIKDGFSGVYFIGINIWEKLEGLNAVLYHAPNCGYYLKNNNLEVKNGVLLKDYKKVWENILSLSSVSDCKTYFGGFIDFDNTPRYGNSHSLCMKGISPDIFSYYYEQLVLKNIMHSNELIWINAWNEWGEGNYLEPDEKNKYVFLESISCINKKYI